MKNRLSRKMSNAEDRQGKEKDNHCRVKNIEGLVDFLVENKRFSQFQILNADHKGDVLEAAGVI